MTFSLCGNIDVTDLIDIIHSNEHSLQDAFPTFNQKEEYDEGTLTLKTVLSSDFLFFKWFTLFTIIIHLQAITLSHRISTIANIVQSYLNN